MTERFDVVLADFCREQLAPELSQERSLIYIAWLLSEIGRTPDVSSDKTEAARMELFYELKNRVCHYGVSPEDIGHRQLMTVPRSVHSDVMTHPPEFPRFNEEGGDFPRGRPLGERLDYFGKIVDECFERFYHEEMEAPDDIIHVSCSGYLLPSPAQKLVSRKRWFSTNVTHSYHMGCYGAFPPVNMASGYLASAYCLLPKQKRRVDIIHTEVLSIHGDFSDLSPGNIVNMTLFGDGFIKYSAYSGKEAEFKKKRGLRVLAVETEIIDGSLDEMTWRPGSYNFEMYLSKRVPIFIRDAILPLFTSLCRQCGIDFDQERQKLFYAIHPGGPKILEHILVNLGIERAKMHWSWDILRHNGNMSSATIPHIWKAMLEDPDVPTGAKIISVAFGPGLTATSLLLEKTE